MPENRFEILAIKMGERARENHQNPWRVEELCLEWNEYINILSVARNQISLWFIELIYGFLCPQPQLRNSQTLRHQGSSLWAEPKINKNISYTNIRVEWIAYGGGTAAHSSKRTQHISGYLYVYSVSILSTSNELFRNQSPGLSYEDSTLR